MTFPFPEGPDARPPRRYEELLTEPGLPSVRLSNGYDALLVTRYAEVRQVLSDDRFSRARFPGRPMFARTTESLALATSDPPVHTRRRRAVLSAFTARKAREQMPSLRTLADDLLDQVGTAAQPVDLVATFAVPFTMRVITQMLGIPPQDETFLRPLVDRMMSAGRFDADEVAAAHEEAARYFGRLVAARAADPGGSDLLTDLLHAPQRGLSQEEVVVFGYGLLMAGYETTSNQLAMCALMVLEDPEWAESLHREPQTVPTAVEEMLRWSALISTGGAPHIALDDVQVGDTLVRAGQVVVPLTDAANRDATVFDEPGCFAPDRPDNPHLAFGHGRHFCLGAHLARAELQVGLSALLHRFEGLRLAVPADELTWRRGMFIRGPRALPVRWNALRDRKEG